MQVFLRSLLTTALILTSVECISEQARDVRSNLAGDSVIQVQANSGVYEFLKEIGADQLGYTEDFNSAHVRVNGDQLRALIEKGHDFEDYTEEFLEQMGRRLSNQDPNFKWCLFGSDCALKPPEVFYSEYQPLESIWERARRLAHGNKRLARIGSIGKSYEGRDLKTIEISSTLWWERKEKPLVFYFCNIHAREWLTPMYCIHMAEELLKGKHGHPILDTYDFTILLSANPDGYIYTWTNDTMWRKTRKPNNGSDCIGTDPNRNYPVNFGGPGSSSDPCSSAYHGADALNQFETKAVTDYIKDNEQRIISVVDVHSFGEMWLMPYGGYEDPPPQKDYDQMMICAEAGVDAIQKMSGTRWRYGPVSEIIYVASGGSVDWIYFDAGILYAYALELRGPGFQPNSTAIMKSNAEVFAGMLASLDCIAQQELGSPMDQPDVPTPPPTSYPAAECKDMVPSNILWDDDTPAPCDELKDSCAEADYVRNNCPFTCGTCSPEKSVNSTRTRTLYFG